MRVTLPSVTFADPKLTALHFNEAINGRDIVALSALMTEGHRFIDSAGQQRLGIQAVRAAWEGFFAAFPDYKNVVETVTERQEGEVVLIGRSICSVPMLAGPALWRARIDQGLVAEWQVYEDDERSRRLLLEGAGA